MQLKTISKIIKTKMLSWISTISDDDLKKDLQKNILVSGGSIASMLLNENVNDFDIYIKDMDILKGLTKYYAKPFNIEVMDGRERESLLSECNSQNTGETSEFDCDFVPTRRRTAIESLANDQIKLFMLDGSGMRVNESVDEKDLNFTPVFFSPNAISLSDDLQIVVRFHGDNEQVHKTFDFIHATNFWTFDDGLVTNKEALESLITKQLRYQGSLYPLTTIIRIKKFLKRGWGISAGEQLKVMFQISELNLKNPAVLENQLIGVDIAYFSTLIECLRGVKHNEITGEYLNLLIDRIFNDDEGEN
jgi:hypothetical protein